MTGSGQQKSRVGSIASICLAVIVMMACTLGTSSGTNDVKGGTITWAVPRDLLYSDPQNGALNEPSVQIVNRVYEGLTSMDENLKPVPGLATSWDIKSPTTYVFHLREGVKFSNGRAMTDDDVVRSLKRVFELKGGGCNGLLGPPFKNVTAVAPLTVQVELTQPFTPLLGGLAWNCASILPMKELDAGTFDPTKQLLGTGPFKVDEHLANEKWTLSRNQFYWRTGYPKVDKLVVRIMPDDSARMGALRDGSVDIAVFGTVDSSRLLSGIANVKVVNQNTTQVLTLDLNAVASKSPFRDVRVRQAFSMAIDRQQIVNLALGGNSHVSGPIAPFFKDTCDLSKLPSYQLDLAKAKQLLQDSGAQNLTVDLIASPSVATFPFVAQVIQQNEAKIGVKVNILPLDNGDWIKRHYVDIPGQFDASLSFYGGFGDVAAALNKFNPKITSYVPGFEVDDPDLDNLISQAQTASDGASRAQILQQACQKVEQNANMLSLATLTYTVAYRADHINARIQSVETNANYLRFISEFARVTT